MTEPRRLKRVGNDLFLRDVFARYLAASTVGIIGSSISIIGNSVIAGFVLGAAMLPVLSLALPFYYLFATVGAMLGVGGAQVCARLIGWQRHEECQRAFSLVYVLVATLGVLLSAVLLVSIDPILTMMNAPPSLLGPARGYLRALCLSGVFIMGIYPAFNMLRLDGQTTRAALLFVGMGVLSVALDLLFLVGFGWGIESIAIALCLSYGLTSISGALMLMRRSLNFRFVSPLGGGRQGLQGEQEQQGQKNRQGWHDAFRLARSIVGTGSSNALENLCIVARTAVINNVAAVAFGTMALGAYVLIDSVTTVTLVFAAGVAGAAMAFLSVFFAERDSRNALEVLKLSFIWGMPAVVALTLLLELLAPDVAALFGAATAEELSVFATAIRVFAAGLPLLLFNYVMITVYQSQGRMPASNAIVLLRELVGPLALMGALTAPLGMVGIWAAFPLAELLTTVMVLLYSFACRRKNPQLSPVFLTDRQAERDGESVSLTVRNDSESIVSAVTTIQTFCERQHLGSRLTMIIQLALEEMLVAIGENSLAGMTGHTMNVRVLVLGGEVIVRIRNGGARFNPLEYAQSLSAASLELTGVMMILKMADVVDYRSTFGVNNLMMIVRG